MQDRFLIRAFDKKNQKMLYGEEIFKENQEGLKFLQSTGKRDQKNQLVYEGDIIHFRLPNNEEVRMGTIFYHEDLLTFFVETNLIEEELWKVQIIEVVGNIYD